MRKPKNTEKIQEPQDDNNNTLNEEVDLTEETTSEEKQPDESQPFSVKTDETKPAEKETDLEMQIAEITEKYIRLSAEFDNYRKRTLRERAELIKSAGEDVLVNILPVIDDFDRAMLSIEQSHDCEAIKQGITLIYQKLIEFTKNRGVKEIEAKGLAFNTDLHEAITQIPSPSPDLKGKVVDVVQKGYFLNEKVIRHAKVVVGE